MITKLSSKNTNEFEDFMRKKILFLICILLLAVVCAVMLVACDKNNNKSKQNEHSHVLVHSFVNGICSDCGFEDENYVRRPTEGLQFELNEDGHSYYVRRLGSAVETNIVIPSMYNGMPVTAIAGAAFEGSKIESVYIPNGIKSIGLNAFNRCLELRFIKIPQSVEIIGDSAFVGCYKLKKVFIDDIESWCKIKSGSNYSTGCFSIEYDLYMNGNMVENIIISKNIEHVIERCQFELCHSIKSVRFENKTVAIGEFAFCDCRNLKRIEFAQDVDSISIENGAFYGSALLEIIVDNNNINYSSVNNCLIDKETKTLMLGCKNSIIPNSEDVHIIGNGAFYDCFGLTHITIPSNITTIEESAFALCHTLVEVYNQSSIDIQAGDWNNGAVGCYAKAVYTSPYVSKLLEDDNGYIIYTDGDDILLVGYSGVETELVLPNNITEIYKYSFYAKNIKSITIPVSVTKIGENAFERCLNLNELIFDEQSQLTIIEKYAFYKSGIVEVNLPDSLTTIGLRSFTRCRNLKSIKMQSNIQIIGEEAFGGNVRITIDYYGTIEQWNSITKAFTWNASTDLIQVHCSDGTIKNY